LIIISIHFLSYRVNIVYTMGQFFGRPFPSISCETRTQMLKNQSEDEKKRMVAIGVNPCNVWNPDNVLKFVDLMKTSSRTGEQDSIQLVDSDSIQKLQAYYSSYPAKGYPGDYFCKANGDEQKCEIDSRIANPSSFNIANISLKKWISDRNFRPVMLIIFLLGLVIGGLLLIR